ncbi:chromosome partitioning protein ParA [Vibrio salinus]|uniref:chromosome partitioning protein ParA n=1 Tax=Vibrio salinus TaxID=2899784 RepID=UPI001E2CE14E|nr:chromosome partitioning protein ParA [Vibrio salinus]MCE0492507.1 chromosome partitioning protein ParA [Vibrio salinus]
MKEAEKTKSSKQEHHDEDVVFIEQRDKKSYLYILIAAVLGIALGGLIGGALASNHWETSYTQLESSIDKINNDASAVVAKANEKNKSEIEKIQNEYEEQIKTIKEDHAAELTELNKKVKSLEAEKQTLQAQLSSQETTLKSVENKNKRLNQQTNIQASVFERSRELFQKELKIKQEVESLKKEKLDLKEKIQGLRKECNAYLEGTSWDAHSDACSKQDEANSRISQIDQLLKVHQMDLKEIKALTDNLGLN